MNSKERLVYMNGKFVPESKAKLSILEKNLESYNVYTTDERGNYDCNIFLYASCFKFR